MKNKISVIIITKGRVELLKKSLFSLLSQSKNPDEILIIDNSTRREVKREIKRLAFLVKNKTNIPIKYYYQPKIGSTYARNLGIKKSRSSIITFIDDDCVPDKKWIEEIIKIHKKYRNMAVMGKSLNKFRKNIIANVSYCLTKQVFDTGLFKFNNITYTYFLDTKNFSIPRSILINKKIYFDNIYAPFSIFEDIDFGFSLLKNKIKIIYNPKIIVYHHERTSLYNHLKRQIVKGRAFFLF